MSLVFKSNVAEKKEMSLNDIQSVSLEILNHLHDFCVDNGIKYSLGYGSLIGAIRHKGFIPWDDDVDVVMLRKDFDRFCELYRDNSNFKLFSFSRGNTYSTLARLCEIKKTFVETGSPLFTEPAGVWIDIFPLDNVSEDKSEFIELSKKIIKANEAVYRCRWRMRHFRLRNIFHIRSLIDWILHVRNARKNIKKAVEVHNNLCLSMADQESTRMSMLVLPVYIDRDYSPKSVFEDVVDAPFESGRYKVMKGYDEWLTMIYGDYMTLPPIEKRKRGHSIHKYFWK